MKLYKREMRYYLILVSFIFLCYVSLRYERRKEVSSRVETDLSRINTLTSAPTDKRSLFYVRIPKCGSRSLIHVAKYISKSKRAYDMNAFITNEPTPHLQRDVLQKFVTSFANQRRPTFVERHLHFINFEEFNVAQPFVISMIRDPIEQFASFYNFR